MSKGLEALGKNIRYKKEYVGNDTYRLYIKKNEIELLENYLIELEQIKNSNPSEALECLERFFNSRKKYEPNNKYIFECITCLNSIKQALLKSQEAKHYLKWEDLEFKGEEQTMKVILNGSVHFLSYYRNMFGENLCMIDNTGITIWKENKTFFNDLHLERAE